MGLNTISTYVFWNLHELRPGQFDFLGNADVAEFCRAAQREGLQVILRPGPYVCSEWEMGGLPWWLLKTADIRLRSKDPRFLAATRAYFQELGKHLAPLQASRGGPIILVQVENEYASWNGQEPGYLVELEKMLRESGFDGPFFATDLAGHVNRRLDTNLFHAVNFGRNPKENFEKLRAVQSSGPLLCMEYFTGWYDVWGRQHAAVKAEGKAPGLNWMLGAGASFNLYMVHGGTTFGFWPGANELPYRPMPASYDYDAPISEAGWATPKYDAFRALIARHLPPGEKLPDVPARMPVAAIAPFALTEFAPLLEGLPEPQEFDRPPTMEQLDQAHGCVLYQTEISKGAGESLVVTSPRDFCHVFIDHRRIGEIGRNDEGRLILPLRTNRVQLQLLVEAMGRITYGPGLERDRKGIARPVYLQQGSEVTELRGWKVNSLPFDGAHLATFKYTAAGRAEWTNAPGLYRGRFILERPSDTFLDMRPWGRGLVWVNGHNLGRFWNIGPQQTLYCPGPWLKPGSNEVIILDLLGPEKPVVQGLAEPILNDLRAEPRIEK